MAGPGSITYRHATGTRLTGANSKTINSISAAGVVNTANFAVTPIVGEIMEIFGTQPNYNKGFFAVTSVVVAGTTNITLSPKPRTTGALGSIAKTTQFPQYTISGSSNISEILVLDPPLAYLRVAGANFKSCVSTSPPSGVRKNDRVQIAGSSTAGNNGAWIVHEVLSETTLILRPYDKGEMLQAQSASGTIIVRHGRIRVAINNAGDDSWTTIANRAVPRAGPYASKFYRFCSGSISDYVRIHTIGDSIAETRSFVELAGVQFVDFYLSAPKGASFYSLNEVVVATQASAAAVSSGAGGSCTFTEVNSGAWPGKLSVQLGDKPGNRYSAGNGSVWVGLQPAASSKSAFNMFGSYVDGTGTNEITLGTGDATGAIARPRLSMGTGVVESVVAYGNSGNNSGGLAGDGTGDQNNVLLARQFSGSAINNPCIIGGLLVSDVLNATPFANNVTGTVEFRDPRTDIDLLDIVNNSFAGTVSIKTYQFNPRFVAISDSLTPVPVFYLTVDVIRIDESDNSTLRLIHDVTNPSGVLVGGARYLTRQQLAGVSETETLFSHRVILSGAGYRRHDETIQLSAPVIGDFPVARIEPDYEGEFGE